MQVGYTNTQAKKTLRYSCQRDAIDYGEPLCQSLSGAVLDAFVSERILQAVSPASLELSLAATEDLERQRQQLDDLRRPLLERSLAGQQPDAARCADQRGRGVIL